MNNVHSATRVSQHIQHHQEAVHQTLERLLDQILTTSEVLVSALSDGHKVIAFGNGGTATGLALCGRVGWPLQRRPPSPSGDHACGRSGSCDLRQ